MAIVGFIARYVKDHERLLVSESRSTFDSFENKEDALNVECEREALGNHAHSFCLTIAFLALQNEA